MAKRLTSDAPRSDDNARYIHQKLSSLNGIFADAAIGTFRSDVVLPKHEDEFTELYVGVQIMIDVIREKIAEAEKANAMLEHRIEERTRDLQKSEAMLRSVMENTPSFIELLDRDLKVTFINHTVQGTTRDEVIGKSFSIFLDSADVTWIRPLLQKVLDTGEQITYETKGPGDNKSRAYYHTTAGPIREGDVITGIALMATDISATKRIQVDLEERSAELETFNQMMVGRELKMIELKRDIEALRPHREESHD